mmetsp:Transcript_4280/g.8918  ORF Transcript_4280/g.8918 Transcript_4280/m.8918 type:complete len:267 (+) Transcript_4280:536-1336(+)
MSTSYFSSLAFSSALNRTVEGFSVSCNGLTMSTSARSAHISSCSTAAARKVSQAARRTFCSPSTRSRRDSLPIVVVLPIPLAPMTMSTVGIPSSGDAKLIARGFSLAAAAAAAASLPMPPPRPSSTCTRRPRSTDFMSSGSILSSTAMLLRSLMISPVVVAPISAIMSTSSNDSSVSSSFMSLPNSPSKFDNNWSRDLASPSTNFSFVAVVYVAASDNASPNLPSAVFVAIFWTCATPSVTRFLKKSNTIVGACEERTVRGAVVRR